MHVVATAGHVDHGKSTLIQALTGQQPDRLAEERERGLSITLGYCWTRLPRSGDVAFVDVPGHERFISTMLAGIGPVPCALFVVAADDDWMPQAAEHLSVLDALGIRHGALVITRADLADPGPARERARAALAATSMAGVPDVVVSAKTGEGIPTLVSVLDEVLSGMAVPSPSSAARLWVDRVFTLPGAGTVVTGTLPAGRIAVGDRLRCNDDEIQVRGLQCLGEMVDHAQGVARVSVRIGSGAPPALHRGAALVADDVWTHSSVVDVRIDGTDLPRRPVLYCGSASVPVRLRVLDSTSDSTAARVVLPQPLPWRIGDRVLLRDPGRRLTWRADVLDPRPVELTRRGDGRRRGHELLAHSGRLDLAEEVRRRGIVSAAVLRQLGFETGARADTVIEAGDWCLDVAALESLRERLRLLVIERRQTSPLEPGVPVAEAARALGLPDEDLLAVVAQPPLSQRAGRVTTSSVAELPGWLERALAHLDERLRDRPFRPPDAGELAALSLDRRAVAAAARAGRVLRLSDSVVLAPGADVRAIELLRELSQPFTASQARERLDSSRRVVLPLLAHLDRAGLTIRHRDDRRSVQGATWCS